MKIRWRMITVLAIFALSLIASISRTHVSAAPQAPAPAKAAVLATATQSLSIPETILAINSPVALSQRIVHYEIDAKYEPSNHTVDATEVLTYHNLTGQPLDHFPFHLYQNAFQPNATFVRDAKLMGTRDTAYEKWDPKYYGSENIKKIEVVGQGDLTGFVDEQVVEMAVEPIMGKQPGGARKQLRVQRDIVV